MGNNVTVACNPPQLEDILSFCGSRPVTRKRRKVKRGSSSQHAFLQLWRFHPDKNDENVVLCRYYSLYRSETKRERVRKDITAAGYIYACLEIEIEMERKRH